MLEFNIDKDVCFVPYSPITVRDDTEFRFQIRNVGERTSVRAIVKVDGIVVYEKKERVEKGGFFFGRYVRKYT